MVASAYRRTPLNVQRAPYASLFSQPGARKVDTSWLDVDTSQRRPGPDPLANPLTIQPDGSVAHQPLGQVQNPGATPQPAFGQTYADPGGGWNPWALYDGREGYDGSASDGWYDASRDRAHWELGGRGLETDRNRVWRWTLDQARTEGWDAGSAQNAPRLKAAFLANVARLRRDYYDTPGLGEAAWRASAFAGYDRLPGARLTGGGQAGAGSGQPSAGGGAGGGQPGAGGPQAGGGGDVSGNIPQQNLPGAGQDPGSSAPGGGTAPYDEMMMNDKAFRVAELLKSLGVVGNDVHSIVGSMIARRAPGLFDQWRQTQGLDNTTNPQAVNWRGLMSNFSNIYNSGGALNRFQGDARSGLARLHEMAGAGGMDDADLIPLITGFNQLMNYGVNDVVSQYRQGLGDDAIRNYYSGLFDQNYQRNKLRLMPFLEQSPLYQFLLGK